MWHALKRICRKALEVCVGAPRVPLRATEALVGDEARVVVRVDSTVLDFLGVKAGDRVIVSWGHREAFASVLVQTEIQRQRMLQQFRGPTGPTGTPGGGAGTAGTAAAPGGGAGTAGTAAAPGGGAGTAGTAAAPGGGAGTAGTLVGGANKQPAREGQRARSGRSRAVAPPSSRITRSAPCPHRAGRPVPQDGQASSPPARSRRRQRHRRTAARQAFQITTATMPGAGHRPPGELESQPARPGGVPQPDRAGRQQTTQ